MVNKIDGTFPSSPTNQELISEGNEAIQATRAALIERMQTEHLLNTSDAMPQVKHGMHKEGSAKAYKNTSTPTVRPDGFTPLDTEDKGRLWYKGDGRGLYIFDEVTQAFIPTLSADLGGGGAVNLLGNSLKENVDGWVKGSGSKVTTPTWNTTQDLFNLGALMTTFSATATDNDYIEAPLTVQKAYLGSAWKISAAFFIDTGASFAANDLEIGLYDITGALFISAGYIPVNAKGSLFKTEFFVFPSTNKTYNLRIRAKSGSTTTIGVLRIADALVSPMLPVMTPANGGWISYVPTTQGFGTPTAVDFKYRRIGEVIEIQGKLTAGTTTSAEAQIGIPTGLTTMANIPTAELAGHLIRSAVGNFTVPIIIQPSKAYMNISVISDSQAGLTALPAVTILGTGVTISIKASFPVAQWSNTIQVAAENNIYLSNTESVVNTAGVVAKTYNGIEGSPIVSDTLPTNYEMTLPRPLNPNETIVLEFRHITSGIWQEANSVMCDIAGAGKRIEGLGPNFYNTTGAAFGAGCTGVNTTTIRAIFGGFASMDAYSSPDTVSWAEAKEQFDRWRIRISRGGAMAEVPPVVGLSVKVASKATTTTSPIVYTGNAELVDTHGILNISTGQITAPYSGWYSFTGMFWSSTVGACLDLFKNGSLNTILSAQASANLYTAFSQTRYLTKGDVVDIRGEASITASIYLNVTRIGS